ncbi:MAG: lipid A deacylase LpxR family protein [Nitrospira sp.]|nr:lipid A deacylase LpxR family protein [bacterium]MBL7049160.1 lipid A deacylase LpxR family protein [Nitrospira sp.]
MNKFLLLTATILISLFPSFCDAAGNPWTQTLYFENDLFTGTDSNYTNGIKYTLISPDLSPHAPDGKLPRRAMEFIHSLPFIGQSEPGFTHKVEFSIGQNMYTPEDIARTDLISNDRPYAGWFYIATAYHRKSSDIDPSSHMDTLELQLGIVGPESFAEEAQKLVHKLRDLRRPNGWDNQLKTEPGLALIYERKWLYHPVKSRKFGYDLIAHAGGALGNVYTYLNSGAEFRTGWNIPHNFGASIIRPAGSTRLSIDPDLSIYVFAGVNGKIVMHDIFLDGNTFTDSHSMDKNYFLADVAGGISISYRHLTLSMTQVMRTREFKRQKNTEHSFGSITLAYSFPFDLSGVFTN